MLEISKALNDPGQIYDIEEAVSIPDMDILGEDVSFKDASLKAELVGSDEDSAVLRGRVECVVHARCARCLEPVSLPVEAEVDETFVKAEKLGEDSDQYPINGTQIDIDEMAKDAILLNLPMRFLCDENCKGLCPKCFVNRNKQRCGCLEGDDGNPFSALKDLFN